MALAGDAGMGAGSVQGEGSPTVGQWHQVCAWWVVLKSHPPFQPWEECRCPHFSLNQKQCDVKFGERDSRLAGHSRKKGHAESRAHLGVCCSHHAITTVPHSSLCLPVSVSDERTRSFLDISDSTRRLLQQGQGRSSFLSVKELSARYLSQAAAAAASQGSTTSPVRIIASKRCPIPS